MTTPQPHEKLGCASLVMRGTGVILIGLLAYIFVGAQQKQGTYRSSRWEHPPMIQWAIFINDMRRKEPGLTLQEIIDLETPFFVRRYGAKCRILTPEEQTGSRKGCAYVIEWYEPNPFTVLSDGTIEVGPLLKQ